MFQKITIKGMSSAALKVNNFLDKKRDEQKKGRKRRKSREMEVKTDVDYVYEKS